MSTKFKPRTTEWPHDRSFTTESIADLLSDALMHSFVPSFLATRQLSLFNLT